MIMMKLGMAGVAFFFFFFFLGGGGRCSLTR